MFKQCQKQIIIMSIITTRYWIRSIRDEGNIPSLDQRFEHKVWTKSLVIKSGLESLVKNLDQRFGSNQKSDIRRL